MDNYSVHKTAAVQQALADFGVQPLYFSSYSPEYNLIELAWSKIKTRLRQVAPRMFDALFDAVAHAIKSVSGTDVNNWITPSGYVLNSLENCYKDVF